MVERLLLLGNSYFYYNNGIHNYLRRMVLHAKPELRGKLRFKLATIGGATLDQHCLEHLLQPGRLGLERPFEAVVMMGHSTDAIDCGRAEAFRATATRFAAMIREHGARVFLYQPPAHRQPSRFASEALLPATVELYRRVAEEAGAGVVRVGEAFALAYRLYPSMQLHDSHDGSHPTLRGTFLGACCLYQSLGFGSPDAANGYDAFGSIPSEELALLARVPRQLGETR